MRFLDETYGDIRATDVCVFEQKLKNQNMRAAYHM